MNFTSPSVNLLFRNNEVSFRQVLNGHPASLTRSISETVSRAISETIKATVAQFRSGGSRERAHGAAFPPLFWVKKYRRRKEIILSGPFRVPKIHSTIRSAIRQLMQLTREQRQR